MEERCKDCGGAVIWVETNEGLKIPVDKYTLNNKMVVLSEDKKTGETGKTTGTNHYLTCQKGRRKHQRNYRQ